MAKEHVENKPKANLQTAQNRMFVFVEDALQRLEQEQRVATLLDNPDQLTSLFDTVKHQVFDLLHLPQEKREGWHIGIADSGKRTIELLVNFLCPAEAGQNAIVDTENYVGFNKFSAAKALEKQKGVDFETPFNIALGSALTVNADVEFDKLSQHFKENRFSTLWLSWNSTSTGIRERIERVVQSRNAARSNTIIVADAASLRLFSNEWKDVPADNLPDAFFFSLRKQGLPYDGPNDEFHQARNSGALIVFNEAAVVRANTVKAESMYHSPTLEEYVSSQITAGEQRSNHVKHLLKLNCACKHFLDMDQAPLAVLDTARASAQSKIKGAFPYSDNGSQSGFTLFSDPDAQSDSAYILKVPGTTSAKKVISGLKENGVLISACMHPKMDGQQFVRFAFYPGNSTDEVDFLLEQIKTLA